MRAGQALAAIDGLAFADDAEREVGERGEVAGGADGALRGDHGMHAAIQQQGEGLGEDGAHAAIAQGQGVGAQGHDDAGFGLGERRAEAAGVAADEVELEVGEFVIGDADFAELAEAGIDAVDGEVVIGGAAHYGAGSFHLGDGGGRDVDAHGGVRDGGDLMERERLSAELQHSVRIIAP